MYDAIEVKRIDVSLVLACYNEEPVFAGSVARIVKTLQQNPWSFEIIFVDDKSGDDTASAINQVCKTYSFCRAIYHKANTGRGRTVGDGIRAAAGTVVGYIDIDLEVSPVYISDMVSLILENSADVVIGKRVYRTSPSSILREVLSRGYQWLSDQTVGTGGMDTETGYKFFNRKKILPILAKTVRPGWFWDTEIMVYARGAGLRIVEYPVLFLRRIDKESSVRIIEDTWDYLVNLWNFRRRIHEST
ncbi:glycosyltransferase family 2 protein [Candidatus Gottesmanbacteria bacterium]|nr:glycosyltransferase family 2 protein [Candidatus Gottesmanbacteria bacterium]